MTTTELPTPTAIWVDSETELEELVVAARSGCATSWREIVDRFDNCLWRSARARGLDGPTADDVVQQTWLAAVTNIETLRSAQALGGWLRSILHRECLKAFSLRQRETSRIDDTELIGHTQGQTVVMRTEPRSLGSSRLMPPEHWACSSWARVVQVPPPNTSPSSPSSPIRTSWAIRCCSAGAGDLVEAHVRAGQPHGAQHAFDVLVREAERTGRPTEHAIAARCRGLLYADDEQGYDAFTEALQWHERARHPFEQARSQLCFGEFMRRRRRRPTEARQVLGDALSTFTRLGARLWAQRTEAELRAMGIASRPRREGSTTQLTPQEMQVALVVADGATNEEAAAQLFLSAKTIEFHLSNTYRKLGIRSRAQLVRVFANTSGALGGGEVRDGASLTTR
ncbi:MAG: LuxR C-terminal-related transcriptional regulator [Actinomycetota bacterium]|nr:LuxR C-terminal-related transcriptional regulator [Actinomycetota bacterium]